MAIAGNSVTGLSPAAQSLASWPDVTVKRGAQDGMESSGLESQGHALEKAQQPAVDGTPDEQSQVPTLATIQDPKLIFRTVDGLSRSQDRIVTNRWAIDLYARRVRNNIPFSYLEKIPNQAVWVAKLPSGVTRERSGSSPNKADDLCNKVEATLEADPMRPNPISHLDSEEGEQATALAAEYLRSVMGEVGINWEQKHHWAVNVSLTCGSAFLHYDVDPQGGGYQPYRILAHPDAVDPKTPMVAPEPGPGAVDPLTGQAPAPVPMPTSDPILRYVSKAGQFVTDASQADRVWLPKPTCERIRREQVRLYPPTADIESARGAVVLLWCTLQDALAKWPDTVGKMKASELYGLASWRPSIGQDIIVPFALRGGMADGQSGPSIDEVGSFSPLLQRRMFYYRFYAKSQPEYEGGLQLDVSGYQGGYTLGSKSLEYQVTLPKDGSTTRCRDIPLEQIRPCQDVDGGDPMGWAFLHRIAGSSDTEHMLYSAWQDAINLRLNPHVFIRSTAAVDDDDWADRSTPIILNPTDPEPNYENFSAMPDVLPMIENVDRKMDSAAGLGETGQGLETSTSVSGVAKQITVQQAAKDLSGMLQQLNAAKTRGCRILCQIAQAEFSVPQLMQYTGEDGSVQAEWWTGENLAGVDDIGIEPGTGTTMTPEGKAQLAQFAQNAGWLPPADAAKVGLMGVSRDLGLPPDPVMEAIEREVGLWLKGPPEGWMEAYQAAQPAIQAWEQEQAQFQQAMQTWNTAMQNTAVVMAGAAPPTLGPETQNEAVNLQVAQARLALSITPLGPQPQPPAGPPPQMPWTPFQTRPNDTEPAVAAKWMERLSRAQMSPEYTRYPAPWKKQLDDFYTKERQAVAQIPPTNPHSPTNQIQKPHAANGAAPAGPVKPTLPTQGRAA